MTKDLCAGCDKEIGARWVVALDDKWHRHCFTCQQCDFPIDSKKSFFYEKGLRTCVDCNNKENPEMSAEKFCAACDVAIDKEWVNGLEKKWHPKCFTCIECTRVIDSKEKFYKVEKDGKKVPKCTDCKIVAGMSNLDTKDKVCKGCNVTIDKAWVIALDGHWHHDCFTCLLCRRVIDPNESFHTNDGKPVCHGCNTKTFVAKCAVCSDPIHGTRLMYKNKDYHYTCVNCAKCGKPLEQKEHDNIKIVKEKFQHNTC